MVTEEIASKSIEYIGTIYDELCAFSKTGNTNKEVEETKDRLRSFLDSYELSDIKKELVSLIPVMSRVVSDTLPSLRKQWKEEYLKYTDELCLKDIPLYMDYFYISIDGNPE